MEKKKYIFILSHATERPLEVIVQMKIATNMKAFEDEAEIDFFLMGEGVQLAKKGIAETISAELEGQKVVVGDMLKTLSEDFNVKFFVCHAFMPSYGMTKDDLIENAELKSSSYLGELLLDGRIPLSVTL
ncbi:MAG: DsrE family protein [Nitrospiraceae bacterium]|nr:DsrE family protein [Nitrospiraceae bacterium]